MAIITILTIPNQCFQTLSSLGLCVLLQLGAKPACQQLDQKNPECSFLSIGEKKMHLGQKAGHEVCFQVRFMWLLDGSENS